MRTFFFFNECCSCTPLSGILIRDKKQSRSPEYPISVMRYERSLEIVCCFHTNPLSHLISAGLIIEASEQRDALTGLSLPVTPQLLSKMLTVLIRRSYRQHFRLVINAVMLLLAFLHLIFCRNSNGN